MSDYVSMSGSTAAAGPRDPFYVVKDKVEVLLRACTSDFERWKDLLETTNTAQSGEFADCHKRLKVAVKKLRVDLNDLAQTIDIVEKNRGRFKDIDDEELNTRKMFVNDSKAMVQDVQEVMTSQRTRRKIQADRERSQAAQTGLEREHEREASEFVAGREQSAQLLAHRQDVILDDMSAALARLGDVAGVMNTELASQNEMLVEFEEEVDETQTQMDVVISKISKLLGTSSKCKLCTIFWLFILCIILFFLIIYG